MSNMSSLYTPNASVTTPAAALAKPKAGVLAAGVGSVDFWAALLGPKLAPNANLGNLTPVAAKPSAPTTIDPVLTQALVTTETIDPTIDNLLQDQLAALMVPVAPITPDTTPAALPETLDLAVAPAPVTTLPTDATPNIATDDTLPAAPVMIDGFAEAVPALTVDGDGDVTLPTITVASADTTKDISTAPTTPVAAQPMTTIAEALNDMDVGAIPTVPATEDPDGKPQFDPVAILLGTMTDDQGYDQTGSVQAQTLTAAPIPTSAKDTAGSIPLPAAIVTMIENQVGPTGTESIESLDTAMDGSVSAPVPVASTTVSKAVSSVAGLSPHAAVQAVANHLQNLANNRDPRSLTLQLNPPELGRMQVKMSFGRDKSVRADILIEKSDTLQLMQKDADTLKSALTQAGLSTDASSLNFSLAGDGTFADLNRGNDGSSVQSRGVANDDVIGAFEIKSSEEWSVDPSTGIIRYNIWA
jgi:Flagellar hook-length control protein FliK